MLRKGDICGPWFICYKHTLGVMAGKRQNPCWKGIPEIMTNREFWVPLTNKLRELAEAGDANDGDVNLINDLSSSLERALVRSWVYRNGDWKLLLSPDDRRGIAQKFNSLAKAFKLA